MKYVVVGQDDSERQEVMDSLERGLGGEVWCAPPGEGEARLAEIHPGIAIWVAGTDLEAAITGMRKVKAQPELMAIPILLVCRQDAAELLLEWGLGPGSVDYLIAPYQSPQLMFRVQMLQRILRREKLMSAELVKWGFKDAKCRRTVKDLQSVIMAQQEKIDRLLLASKQVVKENHP